MATSSRQRDESSSMAGFLSCSTSANQELTDWAHTPLGCRGTVALEGLWLRAAGRKTWSGVVEPRAVSVICHLPLSDTGRTEHGTGAERACQLSPCQRPCRRRALKVESACTPRSCSKLTLRIRMVLSPAVAGRQPKRVGQTLDKPWPVGLVQQLLWELTKPISECGQWHRRLPVRGLLCRSQARAFLPLCRLELSSQRCNGGFTHALPTFAVRTGSLMLCVDWCGLQCESAPRPHGVDVGQRVTASGAAACWLRRSD